MLRFFGFQRGARTTPGRRRVLFFGTYDATVYPRIAVLREGFAALGDDVIECNEPLRVPTGLRVRMLRPPWRRGRVRRRARGVVHRAAEDVRRPVEGDLLRVVHASARCPGDRRGGRAASG